MYRTLWCAVMQCGVVWCNTVWCGVMLCGLVWCNAVWLIVVLCGVNIPLKLYHSRPWIILIYVALRNLETSGMWQYSRLPTFKRLKASIFSWMQANFTALEDLVNQSIYSNRKSVSNQTKNDYFTAGFQCSLVIYFIGSYYNFQMIATVAFIIGIALMVVCAVFLKRGVGAIYPNKRTKGFQCPNSAHAEALRRWCI